MATRRRRRKRGSNRVGMMGISATLVFVLIALLVQGKELEKRNELYKQKEAEIVKQIEEEKQRTEDIAELEKYTQTKEYIEKVAKDKLGLVNDNEILFKKEE